MMEKFWNIIYYFVYKAYYQFFLFSNKIDPLCYFIKLPIVKRHLAKKNIDIMQKMDYAYKRRDGGISVMHTGSIMFLLFFFFCQSILNIISGILKERYSFDALSFVILGIFSFVTSYFVLFKDDKYLIYFKKCDKMSKAEKKKWTIITLGTVLFIASLALGTFVFMCKRSF